MHHVFHSNGYVYVLESQKCIKYANIDIEKARESNKMHRAKNRSKPRMNRFTMPYANTDLYLPMCKYSTHFFYWSNKIESQSIVLYALD